MKTALFSFRPYEQPFLDRANKINQHEIRCFETALNHETVPLVKGYDAVCCFVNDKVDKPVIEMLSDYGVRLIALRSAGFNNVDLEATKERNITVVRVPQYSPHAVAEFAVGMILTLNRKMRKAHSHMREHNFLLDGLMGFDLYGKTVGVIGTGQIGRVFCNIMQGFGCDVIAYDPYPNDETRDKGVRYLSLANLYRKSDIISLHCPLNKETHHLIDEASIALMKPGVMIINTSRGAVIDTLAVIKALKTQKIGYLGLDVYEEEEHIFFKDLSEKVITDDMYARLETFPNVLLTGHQAFFTEEAMTNIFECTLNNITSFEQGRVENRVD